MGTIHFSCRLISLFVLCCSLINIQCSAQNRDSLRNPLILGVRLHYGDILSHSKVIEQVSHTNPYGIGFDINRLMVKEKSWRQCNCFSRVGLSVNYFNFDNPDVLGSCINTTIYAEPLIRPKKRLFFSMRAGTGVSFLTTVYDEETNPENMFFSSHISFVLLTHGYIHYSLHKRWNITAGACFNHISNGGIKLPNKGMNFPTFTIGLDYTFRPLQLPAYGKLSLDEIHTNRFRKTFTCFLTGKVMNANDSYDQKFCYIFGCNATLGYVIGKFSSLSGGMEWISDRYIHEKLRRINDNTDHNRLAVLIGHDAIVGRVVFSTHLGVYIYSPRKPMDPVYQRYGLVYQVSDKFFAGFGLKAHRHVAEIMEVRLGVLL